MVKAVDGARLQRRAGCKMVAVHSPGELLAAYEALEDPASPNLMLQEKIPGDDDQVFIFNGYFDEASRCRVGRSGGSLTTGTASQRKSEYRST